jgi:uncharacterized membrane protein SpoIIM required for sporulation/uncharacterized RDD family membrane protein YckC
VVGRDMSVAVDRQLEMETPEHVAIGFDLAGPGSRFAAFLIDGIIVTVALIGLLIAMLMLALVVPAPVGMVTFAVGMLLAFALFWGYFVFFEGFREGQTPGKRRLGLRVVQDGGYPLTLRGAAVRNLLRIVDIQPLPSWLLGGAFIMLHPRAQRLGDIAAGTIVVRERRTAALPEDATAAGPPRLSDREYDVLREYALRRAALERPARQRVATSLAAHFAQHIHGTADRGHLLDASNPKHADALLTTIFADESARRAAAGAATASGSPAAAALLRRQRGRWAEYDALLARARATRLAALPEAHVSRFAALYREVAADLARARTYGASAELLYTLERAVGAGHNLLYAPAPRSARAAWHWLAGGFPALVRRRARVIIAAALLLFGPAFASFAAVADSPDRARALVPAGMIARAEEGAARQQEGRGYANVPEIMMPLFSSRIIANNVQVTFFAFAGGIFAGLGTALILLMNGMLLGGVAGLFFVERLNLYFWSFVLPHGIIELTAICIAGGAGLWLGSALVLPGRRTRRSVLVERAREAVALLVGAGALLLLAGLIEGFISPSMLPAAAKLGFAALAALVLFAYLLLAGRGAASSATAARNSTAARNAAAPRAATAARGA